MGVDGGSLCDEQSTRDASPLGIILKGKVSMNVILIRPKPCHRTENDTMLEVHATDTNRLKESRRRHFETSGELKVFGEYRSSAIFWTLLYANTGGFRFAFLCVTKV